MRLSGVAWSSLEWKCLASRRVRRHVSCLCIPHTTSRRVDESPVMSLCLLCFFVLWSLYVLLGSPVVSSRSASTLLLPRQRTTCALGCVALSCVSPLFSEALGLATMVKAFHCVYLQRKYPLLCTFRIRNGCG